MTTICRGCSRLAVVETGLPETCEKCGKATVEPLNLHVAEDPQAAWELSWMDRRLLHSFGIQADHPSLLA